MHGEILHLYQTNALLSSRRLHDLNPARFNSELHAFTSTRKSCLATLTFRLWKLLVPSEPLYYNQVSKAARFWGGLVGAPKLLLVYLKRRTEVKTSLLAFMSNYFATRRRGLYDQCTIPPMRIRILRWSSTVSRDSRRNPHFLVLKRFGGDCCKAVCDESQLVSLPWRCTLTCGEGASWRFCPAPHKSSSMRRHRLEGYRRSGKKPSLSYSSRMGPRRLLSIAVRFVSYPSLARLWNVWLRLYREVTSARSNIRFDANGHMYPTCFSLTEAGRLPRLQGIPWKEFSITPIIRSIKSCLAVCS